MGTAPFVKNIDDSKRVERLNVCVPEFYLPLKCHFCFQYLYEIYHHFKIALHSRVLDWLSFC